MDFDLSVEIDRPARDVFAMLADIQRYYSSKGSPVADLEKIPPGPTTVGTRFREVVRMGRLARMTIWTEVTAIEPDRLLGLRFRGPGMSGTIEYRIEPTAGGCTLRQVERLVPGGLLRIVSGPMRRMLEPRLAARLAAIRDRLEGGKAEWKDYVRSAAGRSPVSRTASR